MNRAHSLTPTMAPPSDKDIIMGPPPVPSPLPIVPSAKPGPAPKDNQEIVEKYKRLKRKYFELEEVGLVIFLHCSSPESVG
jgi:hypothetical protein